MTEPEVVDSPQAWVNDHIRRYVATGGADGHDWKPGVPTLLLTTRGRRSGLRRRTALIYGRAGDAYVVVASQGGAPSTRPGISTSTPTRRSSCRSGRRLRRPGADRHRRGAGPALGRDGAGLAPYDEYQRKTDREIPVVVLDPVR